MKKILFFCHDFYPSHTGYANAFRNLITSILEEFSDIQITVITPKVLGRSTELEYENLNIIRILPKYKIKKLQFFLNEYMYAREVSKIFKEGRFDILFVETFDRALLLSLLDKDVYSKTIVRIHSTSETEYTFYNKSFMHKFRAFLIKNILSKKIVNICSTNTYHIDFAKKHFLKGNQIVAGYKNFFIIPNTVDDIKVDKSLLQVGNKINLIILGRMDKLGFNQKGFSDFAYALNLLEPDSLNRFSIKIIGQGNLKYKLEEILNKFDNVDFVDALQHEEMLTTLINSDLIVLPSRYEGLSMFALEGLATGNAVIFSQTGGLVDLIEGNGFFFPPQNIESLAEQLENFSSLSNSEIEVMKNNSINLFEQKFSRKKVAHKANKIFDMIIKSN